MRTKRNYPVSLAVIVAVFLSGGLFAMTGANLFGIGDKAGVETRAAESAPVVDALPEATTLEDTFTQVVERVNPAVVQIQAENLPTDWSPDAPRTNPFENTPFGDFFRDFDFDGPQIPRRGLGSGVLIRPDGHILTNNHVIENMNELAVIAMDGTEYEARVIGADPVSDVAVIKIDAEALPYVGMGDSDHIKVGQWVMAFGSPIEASLGNTVTAGIISATGRIRIGNGSVNDDASGPAPTYNFIQTDAAINPGNSGGPLVNLRGELIGINTAIITRTGGYQGIGFAIPVNTVRNVADQLIATGRVERGKLGVSYGPASEALIETLNLSQGAAVVGSVVAGSAADNAGIRPGDIIVSLNGKQLSNHQQLSLWIGAMKPGDYAEVEVNRDGEQKIFRIKLGGWENGESTLAGNEDAPETIGNRLMDELGITLGNVTPDLAREAGFEEETIDGVIVTDIDPTSYAAREANLRQGAVISEIDRKEVRNLKEFEAVYDNIEAGKAFIVRLRAPNGGAGITALKKPQAQEE
ncbi:MAG: Do family serine endopeptidase [Bacteroidetes bacterium SB0662_bin_6]|nr:Do family serine endopeptidase [Bacteroidetes bacterium SB0668_bin_1]MYE03560.1 Do family serine endopeptidase [Bacteroidetes bacterium SB0662_bin_6]